MGPVRAARLVQALTAAVPGEIAAEQEAMLERVALGEVTLAAFLRGFGHRCAGEMDLITPRWREDHSAIDDLIDSLRKGEGEVPSLRRAAAIRRREDAERQLPALVAEWGGSSIQETIQMSLREAQALLPYRERGRHFLMMGYELLRDVLMELGRRWQIGDDVFFLEQDELRLFVSERDRLGPAIARRQLERRAARQLDLPEVIVSTRLNELGLPAPPIIGRGDSKGSALSSGIAEGRVVVAMSPESVPSFHRGDVLVCPSTDPGWMPLLVRAGALVVERGGLLSHGAIVARDLGLPAVVLPGATTRFSTGQPVRVDGNAGCVIGLEESPDG
jgi:pyruvate,water dikinase